MRWFLDRVQLLPRLLRATLTAEILILVVGGGAFYVTQRERMRRDAESSLSAIHQTKIAQIVRWRAARLGDAAFLIESPVMAKAIERTSAVPGGQASEGLESSLRSLKARFRYSDILVVSPDGRLILSASGQPARLDSEDGRILETARREGRPVLGDLASDPEAPEPHIDVAAPLKGAHAPGVVLRSDPRDFLFPLIQSWPTPTASGETVLVRRENESVLYLNDLRFLPHTALTLRIPMDRRSVPAVMAVLGKQGPVRGLDYRGVPVISVLGAIPDSPWFIVAKMDEAEAFAGWRFGSGLIVILLLALGTAAAGLTIMVWQRREKARYRTLFQREAERRVSEERARITLMSVSEGVLTTDAQGRILLMNPGAESLTGWSQEEANGRPLAEVFHILDERTHTPLEDPLSRVQRGAPVREASDRALLVSRDGTVRPVADNGAPIRDENGALAGVVLVFHDVSDERRYRKERDATIELLRVLNTQDRTRELVANVTSFLQGWTGCDAVGVRLREGDDYPYYETRGFPARFVMTESYLCERTADGQLVRDSSGNPALECMCGNILRGRFDPQKSFYTARGSFWTNSTTRLLATTTEADRQGRTRNRCNGEGYESVALIRLRTGNETLGLLQVNDHAPNRFTPELLSFLESAADQIAIAIAHRSARRALGESEEHYRSLFENMLNGFAYCRMLYNHGKPVDWTYLEVNGAFVALTGLRDAVGKNATELIPGIREADPRLFEIYGRVAATGKPERFEAYVAAMDMWFSISVYSPRREHFVAVFDVITERKRAEAGLQLLAAAIEQSAEIILITDDAGLIQYVNPAFETATGYTRAEVAGQSPRILKSGRHDAGFYSTLWKTISGGRTWKGRFLNRRKDGSLYEEEATISPVQDPSGRIVNYVAAKHDITREQLLESQLRQAQKMESIGRLAGGVAHDFNNMLQVISSYVEISLKHSRPGEKLFTNLQQISAAARRSADLTGQLLAFARRQAVNPRVLDLNEAVAGTLKMLRRLIGEDVDLVWKPGAAVGNVKIDPSQLDQVLANLAVNARDAIDGVGKLVIETGAVTLDETTVTEHPGSTPGTYSSLSVSDSGRGMDREVLSHIFEPFYTTKETGRGTGLGLATVYGVVKQNSGFINVYSEPGMGTTFRIYLPVADGKALGKQAEGASVQTHGGNETILLVEDEEAILNLSRQLLQDLGYSVLASRTPDEAIRLARSNPSSVDLLITDVVMPQMNGRQLAASISTIAPRAKCLYMSGYTADVIAHQGLLDKGVNFIAKPFSMTDLASKIRAVLDEKQ